MFKSSVNNLFVFNAIKELFLIAIAFEILHLFLNGFSVQYISDITKILCGLKLILPTKKKKEEYF